MVAPNNDNSDWFEGLRDEAVKQSGREKNPPWKLHEKSFDELYDIVMKQMGTGAHPNDFPIRIEIPGQPVEDSGMMVLGTQEKPDEDSYDTHFLMYTFNESLGQLLATHPSLDVIRTLDPRLERLYEAAQKCEEQVEAVNQPVRAKQSDLLKGFFFTTPYSMEIKGGQSVLYGYSNPDPQISLDEEARKLYEISGAKDVARLTEWVKSVDRFTRGIGEAIIADEDGSTSWKLDIFSSISYRLSDQNFNYWTCELDEDSPEHRTIDTHKRKVWACWNIIGGYIKGKYGDRIKLPDSIRLKQKAEVASRFNQALEKRLTETSKITFPTGVTVSLVPCLIDKYLLTIGVERGKHYR